MNTDTSIPEYVTSKSGKRYRLRVIDDASNSSLSNNFVEGLQNTTDDFSFDDKDLTPWDVLRSHFMSGLTVGYSDELQAIREAGFKDYWSSNKRAEEIYNKRVAKERAYQKALEEKYPWWLSTGAYALGSFIPTAASFIPGFQFLKLGSAASTFGRIGKAAALGMGSGALWGRLRGWS
ncbi:hypothetical protein [Bartonella rattaustraliani]|uniref:hypothetical protein n=1 Tax=Bartonella rattaustraliani TaxID=481139 RepID=UPI0002EEB467|nr:hypothetical protein [Bartonella rattaustraliani]